MVCRRSETITPAVNRRRDRVSKNMAVEQPTEIHGISGWLYRELKMDPDVERLPPVNFITAVPFSTDLQHSVADWLVVPVAGKTSCQAAAYSDNDAGVDISGCWYIRNGHAGHWSPVPPVAIFDEGWLMGSDSLWQW